MPYAEQWAALAARIKGLQDAGLLYFQSSQLPDSYGAGELLRKQCLSVIEALKTFRDNFENTLPVEAVTRLNDLCETRAADAAGVEGEGPRAARAALLALAAIDAEITFILAGGQERIKARSELALQHLQRCLTVDEELAAK